MHTATISVVQHGPVNSGVLTQQVATYLRPVRCASEIASESGSCMRVLMQVGADGGEAALAAWPAGRPAPDAAFAAVAGYLSGQGLTPSQVRSEDRLRRPVCCNHKQLH